jgi:hypothetical protein
MPIQGTLAIIAVLTLASLGTLGWVGLLQSRLRKQNDGAANARHDLEALRREAHSVAFARILLQTEHAAGAGIQSSVDRLTAGFTEQLEGSLSGIAEHMEDTVGQVLAQHLTTLRDLRGAAIRKMESDARQLTGQYQETLTGLREAAVAPLTHLNDLADQQKAALSQQLQSETKRHKRHQGRLVATFDAKLSDVVSNYLIETLGSDVDLGAQGPYLFRMLEEHKDELKQEILDGA